MKKSIQIMNKLGVVLLMLVTLCSWKSGTPSVKVPEKGEYIDVVFYKNTDSTFACKLGADKGGYLRVKDTRDRKNYLLTKCKYLKVSIENTGDAKFKYLDGHFMYCIDKNGNPSQGYSTHNVLMKDRPAAFVSIDNVGNIVFEENKDKTKFEFIVSDIDEWNWENVNVVAFEYVHTSNHAEKVLADRMSNDTLNCEQPFVANTKIQLKIKRQRRALIDNKISFNDKMYEGKFTFINTPKPSEKDEIIVATSSFVVDSLVIPEVDTECLVPLTFKLTYLENNGATETVDKTLRIWVKPDSMAFSSDSNMVVYVVLGLLVLGGLVFGGFVLVRKKKIIDITDESDVTKVSETPKNQLIYNKQPGRDLEENSNDIPSRKEEDSDTIKMSASTIHSERITKEQVVALVDNYMFKVYGKHVTELDEDTFRKRLNNGWVRQVNDELIKNDLGGLDVNQLNVASMIEFIKNGFIGSEAKELLDNKMNYTPQNLMAYSTQIINYFAQKEAEITREIVNLIVPKISNVPCDGTLEGCLRELDVVWNQLDRLRMLLKANYYVVDDRNVRSMADLITIIAKGLDGGQSEELRDDELNMLKEKVEDLNARLSEKEQEINELKETHQQHIQQLDEQNDEVMKAAVAESKQHEQEEIEKLEQAHQDELQMKEAAYKQGLQEKEEAHASQLESKKQEYDMMLTAKQNEFDEKLGIKADEIASLKGQISDLNVSCHADCARYVEEVLQRMASVDKLIAKLLDDTCLVSGEDGKYANTVRKIQTGFFAFQEQVNQSVESWSVTSVRTDQVRKNLQEFIVKGLKYGWVTIANYLNLYAGATEQLNGFFNENGLNPSVLSQLNAEILRLLGLFGVKVVVPHLLTDVYTSDYFDFENADRWITSFDSQMTPSHYEGKVFDMSCVGYQIDGGRYHKPQVFYC